jgi:hypothetical protein
MFQYVLLEILPLNKVVYSAAREKSNNPIDYEDFEWFTPNVYNAFSLTMQTSY